MKTPGMRMVVSDLRRKLELGQEDAVKASCGILARDLLEYISSLERQTERYDLPISPDEVVKVITDPRLLRFSYTVKGDTVVIIANRYGHVRETVAPDPLSALAWAKGMFDQWDKEV